MLFTSTGFTAAFRRAVALEWQLYKIIFSSAAWGRVGGGGR